LATLGREQAAAEIQLNGLEAKVARAEAGTTAAASGSKVSGSGATRSQRLTASGMAAGAPRTAAQVRGAAFLERHPEVRTALVAYFDATHLAQYGALYSSLGLTPDQVQAMQSLLQSGDSFGRVVQGGSVELSVSDLPPGGYPEQQAQIKALLGDAGYQQFQAYQQTLGARQTAVALAGLLVDSDTPLSADQAQQMVTVLAAAADRYNRSQYNWPSVYAGAAGILTPPQLQMLQNLGTHAQGWQQVTAAAN